MPVPSADAPFSHPALTAFITFYRVSSAADQVRVRKALSATLGWPADSAEDECVPLSSLCLSGDNTLTLESGDQLARERRDGSRGDGWGALAVRGFPCSLIFR